MKRQQFFKKLSFFSMVMLIGISSLSYACGAGAKAPSGGESLEAPEAQAEK